MLGYLLVGKECYDSLALVVKVVVRAVSYCYQDVPLKGVGILNAAKLSWKNLRYQEY